MKQTMPAYSSTGNGPAVLLLHCTLGSKKQWKPLTEMLCHHYKVIAPDLYGYGETPMPANGISFSLLDEVELVHALLRETLAPDEPIHLVGHSYGGAVALRYCYEHPDRVATLTALEPVAFHLLERTDPLLQQVGSIAGQLDALMARGEQSAAVATFLEYWGASGDFARYSPRVQQEFTSRAQKLILDLKAVNQEPLTLEDYRRLALPVTLIAGKTTQPPALRVTERLSRVLPDCTVQWVDAGHMAPVTHPHLVNPIIAESLIRGRVPNSAPSVA